MNKEEAEKVVKETIEYANTEIKKSKKKYKHSILIILAIIFIFIIIFVKKLVIINNIESMASKTNYDNYSKIMVETTEKYISKTEYYQNNDNFIKVNTKISESGISKVISYKFNGKEDIRIFDNNIESQNVNKSSIEKDIQYQFLNKSFFGNIGLALSFGSIKDIKLYNKQCYLLNVDNYLNFVDKENGLTLKEININNNSVIDYTYTFGDITDEKIEKILHLAIN